MYRIGIDVGGTFTDLVGVDNSGKLAFTKSASTPADPSEGIVEGLRLLAREFGEELSAFLGHADRIVHGTTVATNALLERRGAKVGLLTTWGHRDVLEMREGDKDDRYNLRVPPPVPLVRRRLRLGVRERLRHDGTVATALSEASLLGAIRSLQRADVDAVAICFLHSYRDPVHEVATKRVVTREFPDAYVSASSDVLPQIKEYERLCTTVVNAYVGPTLSKYLRNLAARLAHSGYRGDVLVMQSHGGVMTIGDSARLAVGAILSGPAGGIAGARLGSSLLAQGDLITFDMGGTSTDIAVMEKGNAALTNDKVVGGYKVSLPSIDIHTVGAGGGSIAHVDDGGILHVGPESAGADPGPACYGGGGTNATVTDANVVLGYLDPEAFWGGKLRLKRDAAERAMGEVARPLGCSTLAAAEGVHKVANTNMAEGIRAVSVKRGVDPRRFSLLAFGGAAGLHITEVARMLDVRRVFVPRVASVLSAWGMLATDLRYENVRTHIGEVHQLGRARIKRLLADAEIQGRRQLEATFSGPVTVHRFADMRYGEQIFEISVPLDGLDLASPALVEKIVERFRRRHEELYTYSAPDQEIVFVNARVSVVGRLPALEVEPVAERVSSAVPAARRRQMYFESWADVPVYTWEALPPEAVLEGPVAIESATTTVIIRQRARASVTRHGWLDIRIE